MVHTLQSQLAFRHSHTQQ